MNLSAVIVDDEPKARRILRTLLEEYCQPIEVVEEADSIQNAVTAILKREPDVVFLDIEMPEENGFKLFDYFKEPSFKTVFVTAYDQYAIDAFKVSAQDYLLKPVKIDDLEATISRLRATENPADAHSIELLLSTLKSSHVNWKEAKLSLPVRNGVEYILQSDIAHLKADGSYTEIHTLSGDKKLVSKKMGELEPNLISDLFFRTHRSYIVNLNAVSKWVSEDGGYIVTTNGNSISVSRDKKEELLKLLR